jgi:ATP-dependent protease ClpP protease subunit
MVLIYRIHSILQCSPVEIYTTLIGPVGLGPALILAGGTQRKRVAFPNSKISFTPALFDTYNPNMDIHRKKTRDHRELVRKFLSVCAERTGLSEYELLLILS